MDYKISSHHIPMILLLSDCVDMLKFVEVMICGNSAVDVPLGFPEEPSPSFAEIAE